MIMSTFKEITRKVLDVFRRRNGKKKKDGTGKHPNVEEYNALPNDALERKVTERTRVLNSAKKAIEAQHIPLNEIPRTNSEIKRFYQSFNNKLKQAIDEGDLDWVTGLLNQGADVDFKDERGWTPLMHAVFYNRKGIVEMLLLAGADVHIRNENGTDAYKIAIMVKHYEIADLLKSHGAVWTGSTGEINPEKEV